MDRIAAEGRHRAEAGTPGASCSAVIRGSELPVEPATAALERLVVAGVLRRVSVWVGCQDGELGGRVAAGVVRVGAEPRGKIVAAGRQVGYPCGQAAD